MVAALDLSDAAFPGWQMPAESEANGRAAMLSAAQVAERLSIKKDTVYAYVTRGLLRRRNGGGHVESLFDAAEVEALALRSRKAKPSQAQGPAFFRSALTCIAGGEPYYRGEPVCRLAVEHGFEAVVGLIWHSRLGADKSPFPKAASEPQLAEIAALAGPAALPLERLRCLVPFAAVEDPLRHDFSRGPVTQKAARLMVRLLSAMKRRSPVAESRFAALLWSRLSARPATPGLLGALDTALVLVADHDLGAPSTAAVRLAASVRADIYAAISVGLNSGGGVVQSASTVAIESYLAELGAQPSVGQLVGERLRQGHEMHGFGHRAYPDGDPRARLLLDRIRECGEAADEMAKIDEIVDIQRRRGREPPNIGFAIAALAHCAGMQRGAGEAIFNMARIVGWVAHALEEYEAPQGLPRLQSLYLGPQPDAART